MPFVLHHYEKYNAFEFRFCSSFWFYLLIYAFMFWVCITNFEIVYTIMFWSILTVLFFTTLDKILFINKINYW